MIYKLAKIIPNRQKTANFINNEKYLVFCVLPMFISLHYCMYVELSQKNKIKNH